MANTLHLLVASAMLIFTLAMQGQNQPITQPNVLRSGQSDQGANQNKARQPLPQISAQQVPSQNVQQQITNQTNAPSANSPSTEIKESFSQLTLFLFASGLALFIALLGWSDQIRGIDNDTKELEQRFLEKTQIERRDFLQIVKSESPNDQFRALTRLLTDGKIQNKDEAEVLKDFATEWNSQWSAIERLSNWKYNLTIVLTFVLFGTGIISLFTTPANQLPLYFTSVRTETVLILLPMILIGLLLIIIICSAKQEKALRFLLNSMSDKV
jgi:hypothetical protein